jgi:hypothetical protein
MTQDLKKSEKANEYIGKENGLKESGFQGLAIAQIPMPTRLPARLNFNAPNVRLFLMTRVNPSR